MPHLLERERPRTQAAEDRDLAACLVDATIPRRTAWVDGAQVLGYRALLRSLRSRGPLTTVQQHLLHAHLSRRFPPA